MANSETMENLLEQKNAEIATLLLLVEKLENQLASANAAASKKDLEAQDLKELLETQNVELEALRSAPNDESTSKCNETGNLLIERMTELANQLMSVTQELNNVKTQLTQKIAKIKVLQRRLYYRPTKVKSIKKPSQTNQRKKVMIKSKQEVSIAKLEGNQLVGHLKMENSDDNGVRENKNVPPSNLPNLNNLPKNIPTSSMTVTQTRKAGESENKTGMSPAPTIWETKLQKRRLKRPVDQEMPVSINKKQPHQKSRGKAKVEVNEEVVINLIVKEVSEIFNKINRNNFDKMCSRLIQLPLEDKDDRVSSVVSVVFEKAINKPNLSDVYARLVHKICKTSQETSKKFRKQILDQCQKEFQRCNADTADTEDVKKKLEKETNPEILHRLTQDLQEMKSIEQKRALGNVKFLGELYKLQMLTPKIMVECVHLLLYQPDEDKLERLCVLLTTVGCILDLQLKTLEEAVSRGHKPKFVPEANWMNKIFMQLDELSKNKELKLHARVQQAILELTDLRKNDWKFTNSKLDPKSSVSSKSGATKVNTNSKITPPASSQKANLDMTSVISSADAKESTKNILEEYIAYQKLHDTMWWITKRFPGKKVQEFITEIPGRVAEMYTGEGPMLAALLVRYLIGVKKIYKEIVTSCVVDGIKRDLRDNFIPWTMTPNLIAQFLVETYYDENNLDWLVQIRNKALQEADLKEATWWYKLSVKALLLLESRKRTDSEKVFSLLKKIEEDNVLFEILCYNCCQKISCLLPDKEESTRQQDGVVKKS